MHNIQKQYCSNIDMQSYEISYNFLAIEYLCLIPGGFN